MKNVLMILGSIIAFFVSVFAFVFIMNSIGLTNYSFFAPKYRAVENQVFKQSEQYNDGMIRDLENLQMEYMNADQAHKEALRDIIIHRFSVYDQNKLPSNLWNFYQQVKEGKV